MDIDSDIDAELARRAKIRKVLPVSEENTGLPSGPSPSPRPSPRPSPMPSPPPSPPPSGGIMEFLRHLVHLDSSSTSASQAKALRGDQ